MKTVPQDFLCNGCEDPYQTIDPGINLKYSPGPKAVQKSDMIVDYPKYNEIENR